ncbi:MAG: hypothetical protein ACTHNW_19980 [Mucilaginibacter sp.]
MKKYKENELVIYTDGEGRRIDTFVISDSDSQTGLTHINHANLKVNASSLELHPRATISGAIPMADAFSFELFSKLKEKYNRIDSEKSQSKSLILYRDTNLPPLAQAS